MVPEAALLVSWLFVFILNECRYEIGKGLQLQLLFLDSVTVGFPDSISDSCLDNHISYQKCENNNGYIRD